MTTSEITQRGVS